MAGMDMSYGVFYGMLATRRAFTTWPTTTMQYRQRFFALVQSWVPFLGMCLRRAGCPVFVALGARQPFYLVLFENYEI
jgi:hypothetical protein